MEKKSLAVIVAIFVLLLVNISFHLYNWYGNIGKPDEASLSRSHKLYIPHEETTRTTDVKSKANFKSPKSGSESVDIGRVQKAPEMTLSINKKTKSSKEGTIKISIEKVIKYYPGPVKFLSPKEQVEVEKKIITSPKNLDDLMENKLALMSSLDPFGMPMPQFPPFGLEMPKGPREEPRRPKIDFLSMIFGPGMQRAEPNAPSQPDFFMPPLPQMPSDIFPSESPEPELLHSSRLLSPSFMDSLFPIRHMYRHRHRHQPKHKLQMKTFIIMLPPKVIRIKQKQQALPTKPNVEQKSKNRAVKTKHYRRHRHRHHKITSRQQKSQQTQQFSPSTFILPPFPPIAFMPFSEPSHHKKGISKQSGDIIEPIGASNPAQIPFHIPFPLPDPIQVPIAVHMTGLVPEKLRVFGQQQQQQQNLIAPLKAQARSALPQAKPQPKLTPVLAKQNVQQRMEPVVGKSMRSITVQSVGEPRVAPFFVPPPAIMEFRTRNGGIIRVPIPGKV